MYITPLWGIYHPPLGHTSHTRGVYITPPWSVYHTPWGVYHTPLGHISHTPGVYITPPWGVYHTPHTPVGCISHSPGAFFQGRLLDNQEGANTERYVFGKLSARYFQPRPFGHRHYSKRGDIKHGKSGQGRVIYIFAYGNDSLRKYVHFSARTQISVPWPGRLGIYYACTSAHISLTPRKLPSSSELLRKNYRKNE